MLTKNNITGTVLALLAPFLYAQVEVEDRTSVGDSYADSTQNRQSSAELFYKVQQMQQELLELRGVVEEQAYQLKKLKQQRLDDYIDLDRRISQFSKSQASSNAASETTPRTSASPGAPKTIVSKKPSSSAAGELKSYRSAIDLVLKQKNYDAGIEHLKGHLEQYPEGRYAPNAKYWLGEIFLLKSDLSSSRDWFQKLLTDSPRHLKAFDAKFKLGKVYDLMGNKPKAKALLEEVAGSDSNAAKPAKDYLAKHFPS